VGEGGGVKLNIFVFSTFHTNWEKLTGNWNFYAKIYFTELIILVYLTQKKKIIAVDTSNFQQKRKIAFSVHDQIFKIFKIFFS